MTSPHWSDAYEDILRTCLPDDLPESRPIYLVSIGEVGESFNLSGAAAFAGNYLDFDLKPHLETQGRWRGPGYAIIIREPWLVTHPDIRFVAGLLGHEIAHSIESESSSIFRMIAAFDAETAEQHAKERGPRNYVDSLEERYPKASFAKWICHESQWIRAALHVAHRLKKREYFLSLNCMLIAGDKYGLSDASEYEKCIREELNEQEYTPIFDILRTSQPRAFSDLWASDTQQLITLTDQADK